MVFSTALATTVFGLLIDFGHSIESILQLYCTIYVVISIADYCLYFKESYNPVSA